MSDDLTPTLQQFLSNPDRLQLHQLRLIEWMDNSRISANRNKRDGEKTSNTLIQPLTVPDRWKLLQNVKLYSWQEDCIHSWFDAGHKGTVKVVTGGGKRSWH